MKDDMKSKQANESGGSALGHLCIKCCQKMVARMRETKEAILVESRDALKAPERMLRLALNEAEALAWQTAYPHLVFPALAAEKVQAVADWNRHQESVREADPFFALAA
jgi:hypothetical protein